MWWFFLRHVAILGESHPKTAPKRPKRKLKWRSLHLKYRFFKTEPYLHPPGGKPQALEGAPCILNMPRNSHINSSVGQDVSSKKFASIISPREEPGMSRQDVMPWKGMTWWMLLLWPWFWKCLTETEHGKFDPIARWKHPQSNIALAILDTNISSTTVPIFTRILEQRSAKIIYLYSKGT